MKAKEIVQRVIANLKYSTDATEALVTEITADIQRMQVSVNANAPEATAAWIRKLREYNQKWNAILAALRQRPEFVVPGTNGFTGLNDNDYIRYVCAIGDVKKETTDELVELVINVRAELPRKLPWRM